VRRQYEYVKRKAVFMCCLRVLNSAEGDLCMCVDTLCAASRHQEAVYFCNKAEADLFFCLDCVLRSVTRHRKRRLQRQQQSDAARRAKAAGRPIQRGRGRKPRTDSQRDLAAAAAAAAAGAAAAASPEGSGSDGGAEEGDDKGQGGVQGRRGRPKTLRPGRASMGSGEEGGGEGDGSGGGSDSFSDDEDYGTRPRASGLPQIVFRLTPPSADEVSKPISGRRQFKAQQQQGKQQQAGGGAGGKGQQVVAAASGGGEGGAVPQRHRWTPDEDKQLLRWVLANRVELGTRDTVSVWGHWVCCC
jgi:hypothetical protein